jgi:hypothetical protein
MLHPSPACWYLTSVDALGHCSEPGVLRDGRRTVDSGVAFPFDPAVLVVLVVATASGHAIAQLVAIRSPATRHAVLADPGQLHWPVAAVVALVASLYAVGSMASRRPRAGARGSTLNTDICCWLVTGLPRLAPEVRRPPRLVVDEVIANAMIPGPLPARGPPF